MARRQIMIYDVRRPFEWNPKVAYLLFNLYNKVHFRDRDYEIARVCMLDKFVDLETICKYLVGDTRFIIAKDYELYCDYSIRMTPDKKDYVSIIEFYLCKEGEEPVKIEDMVCEDHVIKVTAPPYELAIGVMDRFWTDADEEKEDAKEEHAPPSC